MNPQNDKHGEVFLEPTNIFGNYEPEIGLNGYPGGGLGRGAYDRQMSSGWGLTEGPTGEQGVDARGLVWQSHLVSCGSWRRKRQKFGWGHRRNTREGWLA